MSATTVQKSAQPDPADPADPVAAPQLVRRGRRGLAATLASHGILTVASLIALFPIAWLLFLSLGPDKDDYLHPGGIWKKMTFDNYSFVLQHTAFFDWLAPRANTRRSLEVSRGPRTPFPDLMP